MNPKAIALASSLLFLVGCDRGTAPACASGDSTCTESGASLGGTSGGTSGSNTSGSGTTGNGTGTTTTSTLVFDTGSAIATYNKTQLAGRPSVLGGDKRQIAFFIDSDNSFRIIGSSDGNDQATFNRETIYDVYMLSSDSLAAQWLTTADGGLGRSSWVRTRDASDPTRILWALSFRFYTNARPVEAKVETKTGASLWVRVKSRSGVVTNSVLEDSLPQLRTSETKAFMKYGPNLSAIASDPFLVSMP